MISLRIKRIFLSFAQQYFRDVATGYQWDVDPRKTAIFIGDKYSSKVGTAEKYPAIILTSGTKRWARTSIDQRKEYPGIFTSRDYKVRADLVLASVVFQCLAENGVEANSIADVLFNALVAYKDELRRHGIHQVLDVQSGEEQLIRSDNTARLFAVPVMVSFAVQSTLITSSVDYSVQLYTNFGNSFIQSIVGAVEVPEALMYTVSGQTLTFNYPPASGTSIDARYVDAITLDTIDQSFGVANGLQTVWTLSSIPYSSLFMTDRITFAPVQTINP